MNKKTIEQNRTRGMKTWNRLTATRGEGDDVGKLQIKTTMRYHFPPVKMAIIKKTKNSKCW